MRNLKRALSLLLSSTMVIGMMVMGSSAASYTDVTSEENVEAIEVLKAVGVMTGDENGNFNPDKQVTRAEMAVVMANLLDLKVEDFKGASLPFTDVPEWAVPYVAACYADGITAGISATEYGSNDSVTTAQAALMMMKALGYFQYTSDFGSDWQLATVKQGTKIALFDGIEAGASEAMSRNDVAQIALNTLEANVVEAEGSDGISIGDITIGSSIKYVDLKVDTTAGKNAYALAFGGSAATETTVQLGEQLFKGDLEKNAGQSDTLSRPASKWMYKDEEVCSVADEAVLVYTSAQDAEDVADDLDGYKIINTADENKAISVNTAVENATTGNIVKTNTVPSALSINNVAASSAIADLTGNGVAVEIYATDKVITDIIVVNTTLTSVSTKISTSGKESITVSGCTKVTLEDNEELYNALKDFDVDDDILVIKNGTTLLEVVGAPQAVTGDYTRLSGTKYTIGGTAYEAAKSYTTMSTDINNLGTSYDLLLDQYGYVVKAEATSSDSSDYAFIVDTETEGNKVSGEKYLAQLVFADGTKAWVEVDEFNGDEVEAITTLSDEENNFVSYVKNSDGTYDLKTTGLTTTPYSPTDTGTTGSLDNGDATYGIVKGKVQFLTKYAYTDNWDNGTAQSVTGSSKTIFVYNVDDKLTAYTGIANAPSTEKNLTTTIYTLTKDGVVEMVYVVTDELSGSTASDLVYITDATPDSVYVDADTDAYYEFEAIVDGEVTTVKAAASNTFSDVGLFNVTKYDSNGYIKEVEAVDSTEGEFVVPTDETAIAIKDGVITVDTSDYYVLADEYTIYVIDADGGVTTMKADDVAGLENITGITMVANLDKDDDIVDIAEIYIVLGE